MHYEACKGTYYTAKGCDNIALYDFDGEMYADSGCEDFTARSEWVHLPCEVGDLLYEITERRTRGKWQKVIKKRVVNHIEIGIHGLLGVRSGTIYVPLSGLHKTVFFTREEAEKALEGMKDE